MAKNAGMYIEGRKIKGFADILRNFDYEITFKNAHTLMNGAFDSEDITLRARTFSIPERGNEPIESNYGAMKQFFPGKPTFGNTLQVTFEETESQKVQSFLYSWQEKIFSITEGHARHNRKRGDGGSLIGPNESNGICDLITITAYRFNGDEVENKYYFTNAWLQNVDAVTIDFSQNESIKFNATFQFDFWTYGPNDPTFGPGTNIIGLNSNIQE